MAKKMSKKKAKSIRSGKKKSATSSKKSSVGALGLRIAAESWIKKGTNKKTSGDESLLKVFIVDRRMVPKEASAGLKKYQVELFKNSDQSLLKFQLIQEEALWLLFVDGKISGEEMAQGLYGKSRDAMGELYKQLLSEKFEKIEIHFDGKEDLLKGALVGLDMAAYKFKERLNNDMPIYQPVISLKAKGKKVSDKTMNASVDLASGINVARHLVSLPPNLLNPSSYASSIKSLFQKASGVTVDIWSYEKMKKEGMGMICAVGQGAEYKPCLIHLKYRPPGSKSKKPIALVGKGITFDSGGLDLKPPQFMRWMKKDMGGSAAVAGTLVWASHSGLKQPLDVYLAVAENAVASNAFRPGDVVTARNGKTVEIHNTDAEGRLALGDALDVAVTGKDLPSVVIDVATLTGAIKATLGSQVAGLFSNDTKLRDKIFKASVSASDYAWPVPLFKPYMSQLNSAFADMMNCGESYGGAVTAALFLSEFVGETAWAHLDIYAFADGPTGACLEKGGSGQGVQLLANFLQ